MYALRAYINKSIFGKVFLGIEKVVKTFSKIGLLLCALRAHISKILYKLPYYLTFKDNHHA